MELKSLFFFVAALVGKQAQTLVFEPLYNWLVEHGS